MLKLDSVLQHVLSMDPIKLGYTKEGHCCGEPHPNLPGPQRLQWDIPAEVRDGLCSKRNSSYYVLSNHVRRQKRLWMFRMVTLEDGEESWPS